MNAIASSQTELFSQPTVKAEDISRFGTAQSVMLIGCSKSKRKHSSQASLLYTSRRFRKSLELANLLHAKHFIISGKHGLVAPTDVLSPYDLNIMDQCPAQRRAWAASILCELSKATDARNVSIFADQNYANALISANESTYCREFVITVMPFNEGYIELEPWLDEALGIARRIKDMRLLYRNLAIFRQEGKSFILKDIGLHKMPDRGVYIFVDLSEPNFEGKPGRVVRIGTHGISHNSKSTMRGRLRNHLGLQSGGGSHRGSIFRLHVGRALMNGSYNIPKSITWGVGQDASSETRASEAYLEEIVSNYLRNLEVFYFDIGDAASKASLRGIVETDLIALFTEKHHFIDSPSMNWLGSYSPNITISSSGLWNLRGTGKDYKAEWLKIVKLAD